MGLQASIVSRLVLSKRLFQRGVVEYAKGGNEEAMALAVLPFHDCMELFLQCVADEVGVKDTKGLPLPKYPGKIKDATQKSMIRPSVLEKINSLRVALKHHGLLPGAAAVKDLSAEIEDFLEKNSSEFLGRSFRDVSLGGLISDVEVRGHVKAAEAALEAGGYKETLEALAVAFHVLTGASASARAPRALQPRMELDTVLVDPNDAPSLKDSEENGRFQRMIKGMNQRYERLVDVVEALQLGVDAGNYLRFRYLTPHVYWRGSDGQWRPTWTEHTALHDTKENALFCLTFVIDAALRVQDSPLLLDPWSSFTVDVDAASVPVLRFGPGETLAEERRAPKGERFERVRVTRILEPAGAGGEYWRVGDWDETSRWEGVRFLPLEGVRIVEEHRIKVGAQGRTQ